jgi:CheY-like chemotaxis protein
MNELAPILLIEDDRIDAMTVTRALKELGVANPLVHLDDGEAALEYVKANKRQFCVVLLDLNMPKMGGVEFLKAARANGLLKDVAVMVFIGSDEDRDRLEKLSLDIAGYIVKSVDYKKFAESVKIIEKYVIASQRT